MDPSRAAIAHLSVQRARALIERIETVPRLLSGLARLSRMRFVAIAHVTLDTWIACAVHDEDDFGVSAGTELDISTTLCKDVRASQEPIVITDVAADATYCGHPTPRQYGFRSYVAVPIRLPDGTFYGTLCGLDRAPSMLDRELLIESYTLMADLLAVRIAAELGREIERSAQHRLNDDTLRLRAMDRVSLTRLAEEAEESVRLSHAMGLELARSKEQMALRDQFIAVLGHDLRNPLSAIVAYAELLKRGSADPVQLGIISRIGLSAKRMTGLIGNVMDFTRIQLGGALPVDLERVDNLSAALSQAVKEIHDANPAREIVERIAPIPPVRVDLVRVQQLASNLLGNAVVHGAPGAPVVCTVSWDDSGLTFEVSNGGEPIPPAVMERIFKPFSRGDDSLHREGLGLGLHICQQVATAHGGSLTVSSNRDRTVFTARLPLQGVT